MADPLATISNLLQQPPPRFTVEGNARYLEPRNNHLLHMDNRMAMELIQPGSIDFIYIDPPFASNATYRQQIRLPDHTITRQAYTDRWPDGLTSYIEFLVPRLMQMKTLLSPTGSICVHLDSHSSHYIKVAMDLIFGNDHLINEVIWRYGKMSNTRKRFPQNHDTLLIYAATDDWYFAPVFSQPSEYRTRFLRDLTGNQLLYGTVKHRSDKLIQRRVSARIRDLGRDLRDDDVLFDFDSERKVQDDVFTDISIVRGNAHEGLGYDTQKPQKLLERLISAFCPPEGIVADFFGGSGTSAAAAESLQRRWILADQGLPAIQTARMRMQNANFVFRRDPDLDPGTFEIDAFGNILDFNVDELGLSAEDSQAVLSCLRENPQALVAGEHDGIVFDIFGRESASVR